MGMSMWAVFAREQREAAHKQYMAAPEYPALEREANEKGFRKATLSEIHASLDRDVHAPELYTWRGGLWTPIA